MLPAIEGEFGLTDDQIGWLGSAFMIVYALTSPFTGYAVDRFSRRVLIPLGLGFWSLICAVDGVREELTFNWFCFARPRGWASRFISRRRCR